MVAGATHAIARRAGTDERPLIRLAGVEDPRPLRGELMLVEDELADDEWLASQLIGLPVPGIGTVAKVIDAPSCSVLELDDGTLIPFISDAVRSIDLEARRDPRQRGVRRVRIDVLTLFPHWFDWFRTQRHVTNALALGHELDFVDLRETTPLKAGQVDDTPYGGGAGMVIRVDVVEAALEARYGQAPPPHRTIALSPAGRQFDDALAAELAAEPALTLLSGRYEGFDERVNEHLATDVVSIGPYVLAGGELAAMVVADAVIRKLPGALGHEESAVEESFSEALEGAPEYPHYTRPFDWRGHEVPDVLLSGDHARIREWRLEQSRSAAARGAARLDAPSLPCSVHARRLQRSRFLCLCPA